jgi:hypothetical protein
LLRAAFPLQSALPRTLTLRLSAGHLFVLEHPLAPRVKFATAFWANVFHATSRENRTTRSSPQYGQHPNNPFPT